MRARDLKALAPFVATVARMNDTLGADYRRCECVTTDGHWAATGACVKRTPRPKPWPCRSVNHTAVRVYLRMIRLGPDRLDDSQLDQAVRDLYALTLVLPRTSPAQFQTKIHAAMRVPMGEPSDT